jgi:hypothetical protein
VAQVPAAQAPLGFSFSPKGFGAPPCACPPLVAGRLRPHTEVTQHLDLTEDEAAALIKELGDTIERDRYPFSEYALPEGYPRQAAPRARPRAFVAAQGLCAAASNYS